MADACRCGHAGDGPHPCHRWVVRTSGIVRCGAPAEQRFYQPTPLGTYSPAGAQMKLSVTDTWACAEHWAQFQQMEAVARG